MKLVSIRVTNLEMAKPTADGWADHVVSLVDPGTKAEIAGHSQHIEHFDDVEHVGPLNQDGVDIHGHKAPDADAVQRVLDFTDKFFDGQNIVVHCHGGICRSTAVAILIHVQCGFDPWDAVKRVELQRPMMWPNELVIELGDKILGMDGEISKAVKNWMKPKEGEMFWEDKWQK